jgi:SAM-dependent methyltransferase
MMNDLRRIWNAPRSLLRMLRAAEQAQVLATDLKSAATAELSFTVHDFVSRLNALKTDFADLAANIEQRISALENQQFESKNHLIHLTTSLHSRLDTFENELLPSLGEQIDTGIALGLDLRVHVNGAAQKGGDVIHGRRESPQIQSFEQYLDQAQAEFPNVYGHWRERLDAMLSAFLKTKVGNAAHGGDTYSQIFRSFVQYYATGRVLDIGCGIFGVPYYLNSYPRELIVGLEPLLPQEPPEFDLVRGISEYLPWSDGSFSTVISGTSLDHCLSLERSLAEIHRVLRPDGRFLLWIGSNPGSEPFEPSRPDFSPADEFHLFHFDVAWFEPMLDKSFNIVERICLKKTTFSHVFYCLIKKPLEATQPSRPESS